MISNTYDIEEFLSAIVNNDYSDIVEIANQEGMVAVGSSYTLGINIKYAQQINNFLFFLSQGIRTLDVSSAEFDLYYPICEQLVKKGQLDPSFLDQFQEHE